MEYVQRLLSVGDCETAVSITFTSYTEDTVVSHVLRWPVLVFQKTIH